MECRVRRAFASPEPFGCSIPVVNSFFDFSNSAEQSTSERTTRSGKADILPIHTFPFAAIHQQLQAKVYTYAPKCASNPKFASRVYCIDWVSINITIRIDASVQSDRVRLDIPFMRLVVDQD